MDMSANEPLKALNHVDARSALGKRISTHLGLRAPFNTQLGRRNCCLAGRPPPLSGSASAAVSSAFLIGTLLLFLAGCAHLEPEPPAKTRLISPADTGTAHELSLPTKPPEAPSKPAPPVPQPAQRSSETKPRLVQHISETKPPPATASKGAEKLIVPNAPVLVHAREKTTLPAEPPVPKAPIAEVSNSVTSAPVQALILRGPPPEARHRLAGIKVLMGLGLVLGVAAVAIPARLYIVRRAKPAAPSNAKKEELEMPKELLFKEPVSLSQEAVATEKP